MHILSLKPDAGGRWRLAACVLYLLACHAVAAPVGPSGFTRDEIAAFAAEVQGALALQDARKVAALTRFPLAVNLASGRTRRVSRSALLHRFDRVFTPAVITEVRAQDPMRLFENSDGVMFGDGVLWAHGVCDDKACSRARLVLFAVNLPAPAIMIKP